MDNFNAFDRTFLVIKFASDIAVIFLSHLDFSMIFQTLVLFVNNARLLGFLGNLLIIPSY